jgi:hypothetical protein
MELQQRFRILLRELEKFYGDDLVALTHENWAMLKTLSMRKIQHLRVLQTLAPLVNKEAEADLMVRIRDAAQASRELLEKKLSDYKEKLARLRESRFKIRSARTYLKTNQKTRSIPKAGTKYA